jgi:short-subunit dehydrogenase
MNLQNQVVLITGASSGIGRQLALDLARHGAVVIGCGRSIARLTETLKEVRPISPSSLMIGCDVGDAEQVKGMVGRVLGDFARIDILINNAGIGMRRPFVQTPIETIEEIIRTNYLGMIYCTHEVLPTMIAQGSGHIVNISSGAGKLGMPNMAAYCGSKFAMNGFSESLYHELKPLGIHVSVICPGPVNTEFSREFRSSEPKSPPGLIATTEAVCQAIIGAIEKKKFEIVMPRWLALINLANRIAPNLVRALAQRLFQPYIAVGKRSTPPSPSTPDPS